MTEATPPPIVYVDANPFVYLVEGEESIAVHMKRLFFLLKAKPGIAVTSELTLAEVLAKARPDVRRRYLNLIVWSKLLQLHPITRNILIDTADYRRASRTTRSDGSEALVKLPDAIHVVTAIQSRCRFFLSADEGLKLPVGIMALRPNEHGLAQLERELA